MGTSYIGEKRENALSWKIEETGGVVVVYMNSNPMNLMNEEFFNDLQDTFLVIEKDYPESPVVLASSERVFSAGLDIKRHFSLFKTVDQDRIRQWYKQFISSLMRIFTYERPVVAAVNGHAIAGGLIIALCCDYRICVDSGARFGLNEITIGFPLPAVVGRIILYALGEKTTRHVLMTGHLYEPSAAKEIGFFNEICEAEKLIPYCVDFAGQYSPHLLPGYAFSKKALRYGVVKDIERTCSEIDKELPSVLTSSGVLKSLEKMVKILCGKKQN